MVRLSRTVGEPSGGGTVLAGGKRAMPQRGSPGLRLRDRLGGGRVDATSGGAAALGLGLNGDKSLCISITNNQHKSEPGATRPNMNRQHGYSTVEPVGTARRFHLTHTHNVNTHNDCLTSPDYDIDPKSPSTSRRRRRLGESPETPHFGEVPQAA